MANLALMLEMNTNFNEVREVVNCNSCTHLAVCILWTPNNSGLNCPHYEAKTERGKCHFPDGMTIKPDGINELDPCEYEVVEKYRNVTVEVLLCKKCGNIEISWHRQHNTIEERE